MRLRYGGSAGTRGFALRLAGTGKYEDTTLPTGSFVGARRSPGPRCGLHLTARHPSPDPPPLIPATTTGAHP
ncbi:hypothetical protein [Streptomyces sp. YIM 98790]|uniref:hypothetical protein n=1 Tax=Streptomyces sp. YIM 98790 TaxID=2689077 RepID=UPI001A9EBDDE|nr:hypothetical protein [Streptomyces sp. YIM 98790]